MSDLHSFQDDIYRRRGHSVAVNNEIYDESSDSDLTRAEDSKARMVFTFTRILYIRFSYEPFSAENEKGFTRQFTSVVPH